jgi:hypothetical protein
MENKNRHQRNADFVCILQRQGKTISINEIMCSHVTTHVTVTSAACLCMFLHAKDHGAEKERDMTRLEKGCCRFVVRTEKTYQTLREYCSSQDLQYQTLSENLNKLVQ